MDNFAREIDRGLRRRGPDLLRKSGAVFLTLSLLNPVPAAHCAEFEISADSFTVVNQVNISSVTYFQTRALVPPNPALATQMLTPGGLYFDATYYNVWDRTALAWVKLATGTVEAGRVAKAGDFMSGQLTTASTITVQGNAFSVGGSTLVVSGGNVGIGTTSPDMNVMVRGGSGVGGEVVGIHVKSVNASNPAALELDYASAANGKNFRIRSTNLGAYGGLVFSNQTDALDGILTMTAEGRIGIGNYTPAARLHVSSANASAADTILQVSSGTSAGQELLVVKGDGKVGIGTTGPGYTLDIVGPLNSEHIKIRRNGGAGGDANGAFFGIGSDGNLAIQQQDNYGMRFITNNAEAMRILASGSVGIGTTAPKSGFDIENTVNGLPPTSGSAIAGGLRISNSGNIAVDFGSVNAASPYPGWIQVHDSNNWASNFPLLLNPNGGNVGVGTAGPGAKLDVAGNIKASQSIVGGCVNPDDAGDVMVPVGDLCVDKYETSVWSTATGGTQYGINGAADYPCGNGATGTGQTCAAAGTKIFARSVAGVKPSTSITWFQANIACANAGKHLLTNAEWQAAAAGTADPGALAQDAGPACNTSGTQSMTTGNGTSCLSSYGVENMIGSVWEWVADWGQYGQISQAAYVAWADGTFSNTHLPAGYNADGSWNVAGKSYNGTAWVNGLPGAVIRGGSWGNGADAGVFAFHAGNGPSGVGTSVGLRCGRRR